MKKKFYMLLTALLALMLFATASAATLETLQQQAMAYLPADSVYLSLDNDDGQDELKYWSESYQAMYEVCFDTATGDLNKIKGESWRDYGSKNVVLTEEQALLKLAEVSPEAIVDFVVLDQDDGLYEYKLAFHTETYYGVLKLSPETGAILEYEHDYASVRAEKAVGLGINIGGTSSGEVTPDEAKELVLARLEGGSILYIQEDWDDGRLVYEGEATDSTYEYDFEIDATTGRFLEWERDQFREMAMVVAQLNESSKSSSSSSNTSSSSSSNKSSSSSSNKSSSSSSKNSSSSSSSSDLIGTSKAKEIALNKAGGGRVVSIKLDREDGRQVYEGEVHDSKYEYEFEIDAKTGKIREWDKERLDD